MHTICRTALLGGLLFTIFCAASAADGFYEPDGRYVCQGDYDDGDRLSWRTILITIGDGYSRPKNGHPDAEAYVEGLNELNASYMTSSNQLVVFAPYDCLVGVSERKFSGCSYVGIITFPDGTFTFYKGDYNEDQVFYWSQKKDGMVCEKLG